MKTKEELLKEIEALQKYAMAVTRALCTTLEKYDPAGLEELRTSLSEQGALL